MAQSAPNPQVIHFAASFYGRRGEDEKAQTVLAKREALDISDADKAMLMAEYLAQYGKPAEAIQYFQQAVKAAPQRAELWHRLVSFCLLNGQRDAAVSAAREANSHLPSDEAFAVFAEQGGISSALDQHEWMLPVIASLMGEVKEHAAVANVLRQLGSAQQADGSPAHLAESLEPLANQYPQLLPLQMLVGQLQLMAGRPEATVQLARQAMQNHPTSPEPAWLAAQALSEMGQWRDARSAAAEWRRRANGSVLRADMMIAQAELNMGQATGALNTLAPYLELAKAEPDRHAQILTAYAQPHCRGAHQCRSGFVGAVA